MIPRILEICQEVLSSAEKETLYSTLDSLIMGLQEPDVDAIVQELQVLDIHEPLLLDRATYEYDREVILAEKIIEAGDPSPLENFRSTEWYEDAHRFENSALAKHSPTNILMVGCGAFPSTALSLMNSFPDANLVCLDKSAIAYHLAIQVSEIFGHELYGGCVDVLKLPGWTLEEYDCILVGTVVGVGPADKKAVVDHFLQYTPSSTTLALRTAVGPGKIIYPVIPDTSFGRVLLDPPQKTWTTVIRASDI